MTSSLETLAARFHRKDADGRRIYSDEDVARLSRQLLFTLLAVADPVPDALAKVCEAQAQGLGFRPGDPPETLRELLDADLAEAAAPDTLRAELERALTDLVDEARSPSVSNRALEALGGTPTSLPSTRVSGGIGGGPLAASMLQARYPNPDSPHGDS